MTKITLLILLQSIFVISLRKQTLTGGYPLIEHLHFQDQQIFYVSADHRSFGNINRSSGSIVSYSLQTANRLISYSQHQVMISQQNKIIQYSIFASKQHTMVNQFLNTVLNSTTTIFTQYYGFEYFSFGYYALMDSVLFFVPYSDPPSQQKIISLSLEAGELPRQLATFQEILLVFSYSGNKVCFTQIQKEQVKGKKCINRIDMNTSPKLRISGRFIYVIHAVNKVQLLDHNFGIIETFQESFTHLYKNTASFPNFRTFDASSKSFKNWKVVQHQSHGDENTLVKTTNYLELREGDHLIAKIQNISSQPYAAWMDKSKAFIGKIGGKYQLLIQLNSGTMNYYQIIVNNNGNSTVSLKWSH